ncbi:MAG: permease-like cell division protein FtsX [Clostridia bacterium]|nr:permease-like cell division protein FtsX [Clostridia bacterium]
MKRYNIFYFIGQSISSMWRNGVMTFASIAVLMSLLVVIGGFTMLVVNIDKNLDDLGVLNEIVVFCDRDATEEQIVEIGETINKLDNIDTVERITKEQGLKELQEEQPNVYDDVTADNNPLPDSFVITYINNNKVPELDYQLRQIPGIIKVNNRLDLATTIESLKSGVMLIFIWFLAILAVVSIFIIINTIKLSVFSRRNEISIMRYVGATGWFISLPFIFEGIFIGLFASVIGYFIEWYVYSYIENIVVSDYLQMISIIPFEEIKYIVLVGFIGIGVVTGIIGSCISLGKYLKQ